MFKVTDDATYTWPVTVHRPINGGKFSKGTFTAHFSYLDQEEIDQVLQNARNGHDNGDLAAKALCGWGAELLDAGGAALEYSEEAKAALLKKPYIRNAVVLAFIESISGDGARRKN